MSAKKLAVLMAEDNPGDADLVIELLRSAGPDRYELLHVERLSKALEQLTQRSFDLILLDLSLPDSTGLDTLIGVLEAAPRIPIVVLSGMLDETLAIQAVQRGAQDYLIKGQASSDLLSRAIGYAIERKRLMDGLVEQNERLKELDRMKSEFVSVVTHELRTPMTAIQVSTRLLDDGSLGPLNAEQREYLEMVQRNVTRLATLINQVLDISRIESGRLHLDLAETDLKQLLTEVIAMLLPQAQEKRCDLLLEHTENPVLARCDSDKIIQVLVNLVGNAIKHNPRGTKIYLGAREEERRVLVWVRDTGVGIPKKEHVKIFERFYQIQREEGGGSKGTGLGLSISKGLVEAHGGQLTVASEPGKGTLFKLDLERVMLPPWKPDRDQTWSLRNLTLKAERYKERVRLIFSGSIDIANCGQLTELGQEILDHWGRLLIMDLSRCERIDSRGLGLFIELRARAIEKEGDMVFVNLSPKSRRVLDAVGIIRTIPAYTTLSEAFVGVQNREQNAPQGELHVNKGPGKVDSGQ